MALIAFVTTADAHAVHDDLDRPIVDAAFARAGLDLVHVPWEDESVEWDAFDLVVVRSPWNYVENESSFRRFLDGRRSSERFHNPAALIEWNIDKRYLLDLAALGVPVIPTVYVDEVGDIDAALGSVDAPEIVVKPTVSAGSRLTGRFVAGDPRAAELCRSILDDGRSAMVQPYLPAVDVEGEYAAIVIDGQVAHRAIKAQILDVGGTFVGGVYREVISAAAFDDELERIATTAASACRDLARDRSWIGRADELLYARYDVARTSTGAVLLEAELFEPALFLPSGPEAADELVSACRRRIDQDRS